MFLDNQRGTQELKNLVYVVSGGISQRDEQCPATTPRLLVQEACEYAFNALGISFCHAVDLIDGIITSHADLLFSDSHAPTMFMEHIGLPSKRLIHIEEHDAMGGLYFQEAVKQIEAGGMGMDICLAYGWEMATARLTTNGKIKFPNHLVHMNGDINTALLHIEATNATPEQIAKVSVKNHCNAAHNPYACRKGMIDIGNGEKIPEAELTVKHMINNTAIIEKPLINFYTCDTPESAAACIIANKNGLERLRRAGAKLYHSVIVSGMGQASNNTPLPHNRSVCQYGKRVSPAPSATFSSNPTQIATHQAYTAANITYPFWEIDFIELHDSCAPFEIKTYEDLGLCDKGKGGMFIDNGYPFLPSVNYGTAFKEFMKRRVLAVNPSGGLIACGHAGSATALRQIIFSLWQLQGTIKNHFGSKILQVPNARRGAVHSCTETGDIVTVSILEK